MNPRAIATIAVALFLVVAGTPVAQAGSHDFLFSVSHVSNDDQYFLNLTVSNYGYSRAAIEPVLPRLDVVDDDLPVAIFLAKKSRKPLAHIVDLRARGTSWSVVFGQVGVPIDVLFAGIDRDPGPPYGKAWGHWKKDKRKAKIADRSVVGLVQVQIGAGWAGLSTFEMAQSVGKGRKITVLVADKKGRPHKKEVNAGKRGPKAKSGHPAAAAKGNSKGR